MVKNSDNSFYNKLNMLGSNDSTIVLTIVYDSNQSALKHGRRIFLYSAMGELVCSGQLWARAALKQLPVTRSDSESIFQQQFGEYHGYDGCY